jgi:hypothetical protein
MRATFAFALAASALLLIACGAPPRPPEDRNADQRAVGEWADSFRVDLRVWQADRERVGALASQCPGPAQAMQLSSGAVVRDGVRQDRQQDFARRVADALARPQRQVANQRLLDATTSLSLADWDLRRAADEQRPDLCDRATEALSKADQSLQQAKDSGTDLLRSVSLDPLW